MAQLVGNDVGKMVGKVLERCTKELEVYSAVSVNLLIILARETQNHFNCRRQRVTLKQKIPRKAVEGERDVGLN